MRDPIGAYAELQDSILRYVDTAFGSASTSFNDERRALLSAPGVLFKQAMIEPLSVYAQGKALSQLEGADLPEMDQSARAGFCKLVGAKLFATEHGAPESRLYVHQQDMLRRSLAGEHCVITTGTGSGKTESFLLPLVASLVKERSNNSTPPVAMRALVLYPMNALVEDQISRLREALDSEEAHAAYAELGWQKKKITFGRYNGQTPIPGHPVRFDPVKGWVPNKSKRDRQLDEVAAARAAWQQLSQQLRQSRDHYNDQKTLLEQARAAGNNAEINRLQREVKAAEGLYKDAAELTSFFTRMDDSAAEKFDRWSMQASPPDILITNFSMLSIMLMRHVAQGAAGDSADGQIFDATRDWLRDDPWRNLSEQAKKKQRPSRIFHLIVDELHLYRGTAGTEVSYLVRLLLSRLGLAPDSPQLRILASSASLTPDRPETMEFLGNFFGLTAADVANTFAVIADPVDPMLAAMDPSLTQGISAALSAIGQLLATDAEPDSAEAAAQLLLIHDLERKLRAACVPQGETRTRAVSLSRFQDVLFPHLAELDRPAAGRALLYVLSGIEDNQQRQLPRFRIHWMIRNVEGIWASLARATGDAIDDDRTVGKLFADQGILHDAAHNRVLETLYCDCCGTLFLAGYRAHVPVVAPIPGMPVNQRWELLPVSPALDNLPHGFMEKLTDRQGWRDLAVFWPLPEGNGRQPQGLGGAQDGQITLAGARTHEYKGWDIPQAERRTDVWRKAVFSPLTGILEVLPTQADFVAGQEGVKGYYFDVNLALNGAGAPAPDWDVLAMPHTCPNCGADYGRRNGKLSPVRTFRTGLNRMSQLLAKHLFFALDESNRKLVAFSDSREAAAVLANGVENLH